MFLLTNSFYDLNLVHFSVLDRHAVKQREKTPKLILYICCVKGLLSIFMAKEEAQTRPKIWQILKLNFPDAYVGEGGGR